MLACRPRVTPTQPPRRPHTASMPLPGPTPPPNSSIQLSGSRRPHAAPMPPSRRPSAAATPLSRRPVSPQRRYNAVLTRLYCTLAERLLHAVLTMPPRRSNAAETLPPRRPSAASTSPPLQPRPTPPQRRRNDVLTPRTRRLNAYFMPTPGRPHAPRTSIQQQRCPHATPAPPSRRYTQPQRRCTTPSRHLRAHNHIVFLWRARQGGRPGRPRLVWDGGPGRPGVVGVGGPGRARSGSLLGRVGVEWRARVTGR